MRLGDHAGRVLYLYTLGFYFLAGVLIGANLSANMSVWFGEEAARDAVNRCVSQIQNGKEKCE